jgi:dihydrofolate reductase
MKQRYESNSIHGYSAATRKAGNLIVGHRTYGILTKQLEFAEFKDVKVVVVAHTPVELVADNHAVADSPQQALELLKDAQEVVVAGGGALNASFMAQNLVDEIYIDIEPIAFGTGIPLFHGEDFERSLKLLGIKNISGNEIQLHYQVLK